MISEFHIVLCIVKPIKKMIEEVITIILVIFYWVMIIMSAQQPKSKPFQLDMNHHHRALLEKVIYDEEEEEHNGQETDPSQDIMFQIVHNGQEPKFIEPVYNEQNDQESRKKYLFQNIQFNRDYFHYFLSFPSDIWSNRHANWNVYDYINTWIITITSTANGLKSDMETAIQDENVREFSLAWFGLIKDVADLYNRIREYRKYFFVLSNNEWRLNTKKGWEPPESMKDVKPDLYLPYAANRQFIIFSNVMKFAEENQLDAMGCCNTKDRYESEMKDVEKGKGLVW